jgi:hypothetical protein
MDVERNPVVAIKLASLFEELLYLRLNYVLYGAMATSEEERVSFTEGRRQSYPLSSTQEHLPK